jgi:hypothetical protein
MSEIPPNYSLRILIVVVVDFFLDTFGRLAIRQ